MRRIVLVWVLGLSALSLASGTAEREVMRVYQSWVKAASKGDVAVLKRVYADEYSFTDHLGRVTTKEQEINFPYDQMTVESWDSDDVKVRVYGGFAVLTSRESLKGHHQSEEFSGQYRFTFIFLKRDGRWQIIAAQSTRITNQGSGN